MQMKTFDVSKWNRKAQYEFFKTYDDPYFNLTTEIDVTHLQAFCKTRGYSFFLSGLFLSLQAANEITEFRLRIKDDKVVEFEQIDIGSTVLMPDNSFVFCHFANQPDLKMFNDTGKKIIEAQRQNPFLDSNKEMIDLIYASSIPWTSFTSIKHARSFEREKYGIPKFVFGKFFKRNGSLIMPFSVEVHHALMDGYHVGLFLDLFQKKINAI